MNWPEGCVGTFHWFACNTCKHGDEAVGCTIGGDDELSNKEGDWVICEDYEKEDV